MEVSKDTYIEKMNLDALREFAEQRGIDTKIASRLWYALAREALSQSPLVTDDPSLTYDDKTETLHFYHNPQEYAGNLRNIGRVSLHLLDEFMLASTERHA